MSILNRLPKFDYIEPNNLKGLQPGFVVAQMEIAKDSGLAADGMFENGYICKITAAGIEAVVEDDTCPVFIHYSEPLNTFLKGDEYFAVNVNEECPRLVQLIPGDEWMSSRELTTAELMKGRIVKLPEGKGFFANKMANGDTGYHYMFLK